MLITTTSHKFEGMSNYVIFFVNKKKKREIQRKKYGERMRERRFIPFTSISSTYTTIISNLVCNFLIKMHYHIGLFIYHFFNKYALR